MVEAVSAARGSVNSLVVREGWVRDGFPGLSVVDGEARHEDGRQDGCTLDTAIVVRVYTHVLRFVLVAKLTCVYRLHNGHSVTKSRNLYDLLEPKQAYNIERNVAND